MSNYGFMPENAVLEAVAKQQAGANGCDIIWDGDTDEHTGNWAGFIVMADTVVDSITDSAATGSSGIDGGTLLAGSPVTAAGQFTSITLTSGTIILNRA